MIRNRNKYFNPYILISIGVHGAFFAALILAGLSNAKIEQKEGDTGIKAIMVNLEQVSAPEQSLVENNKEVKSELQDNQADDMTEPEAQTKSEVVEIPADIVKEKIAVVKEVEKKQEVKNKPVEKPKKEKKKRSPSPQRKQVKQEIDSSNVSEQISAPSISESSQLSSLPSPISRKNPVYPRKALDRRIEGYVIVVYDINIEGKVENIRIIEVKPNNIFNRSVIKAMNHWKFEPKVAKNLTTKIIFNRKMTSLQ